MPIYQPVLQGRAFVAAFRNLTPAPVSAVSRAPRHLMAVLPGKYTAILLT